MLQTLMVQCSYANVCKAFIRRMTHLTELRIEMFFSPVSPCLCPGQATRNTHRNEGGQAAFGSDRKENWHVRLRSD